MPRKPQTSRLQDPSKVAMILLRLIKDYHNTADRFPKLSQLRYYGYSKYELNICIPWLSKNKYITIDQQQNIISYQLPDETKNTVLLRNTD